MSSAGPQSYPEGPRHGVVTSDDHGAVLNVVAWFLMVVMILSTFLRLLIRFTTTHVPGLDDIVLAVAMVSQSTEPGVTTRASVLTRVRRSFSVLAKRLPSL